MIYIIISEKKPCLSSADQSFLMKHTSSGRSFRWSSFCHVLISFWAFFAQILFRNRKISFFVIWICPFRKNLGHILLLWIFQLMLQDWIENHHIIFLEHQLEIKIFQLCSFFHSPARILSRSPTTSDHSIWNNLSYSERIDLSCVVTHLNQRSRKS